MSRRSRTIVSDTHSPLVIGLNSCNICDAAVRTPNVAGYCDACLKLRATCATLIFSSREEAKRAEGLIRLDDQVDSSPFHRRISVKMESIPKALMDLREDGFTDLRIELQ